jgi:2-hydroxy-3-keto-5-methylthiopentenyl-1-phosphate phosphatase
LGAQLILATASPALSTNRVIGQSPILFNETISSNAHINLKGSKKLEAIRKRMKNEKNQDFIYFGDSFVDLKIMKNAKESVFVGSSVVYFVGKYIFRIQRFQTIGEINNWKEE